MNRTFPTIEILGVQVARLGRAEALRTIERLASAAGPSRPALVFYANAHTLNTAHSDERFRRVLERGSIVLNDGSGVALAARVKGGAFDENLNGSDLNPEILRIAARREWPVFLLGGARGVAEAAAANLRDHIPGLDVVGVHHGYLDDGEEVVAEIRRLNAQVVMVAMGNPLQEQWLVAHLAETGARLGVGVGAFFDFAAGRVPRAPRWMRRMGIEWVYRLKLEPGRMWRRYLLGNPLFLLRVMAARTRKPRPPLSN